MHMKLTDKGLLTIVIVSLIAAKCTAIVVGAVIEFIFSFI